MLQALKAHMGIGKRKLKKMLRGKEKEKKCFWRSVFMYSICCCHGQHTSNPRKFTGFDAAAPE